MVSLIHALLLSLLLPLSHSSIWQKQRPIGSYDSLDVPGDNPLVYCEDTDDYILDIDHIDLKPNPPEAGKNVTIEAEGTLSEDIRNGSKVILQVKLKIGGSTIPLLTQERDLCKQMESVDRECPISKGDLDFTDKVALPKHVPKGTYVVVADAYNDNEDKIMCVEATIQF